MNTLQLTEQTDGTHNERECARAKCQKKKKKIRTTEATTEVTVLKLMLILFHLVLGICYRCIKYDNQLKKSKKLHIEN